MHHRTSTSVRPRLWERARRHGKLLLLSLGLLVLALSIGAVPSHAAKPAAALRAAALRATAASQGKALRKAVLNPNATPDYFGTVPNYANSPLPRGPIGS